MLGFGKREPRDGPTIASAAPDKGPPIIAALLLKEDTFDLAALEHKLACTKPGGFSPVDMEHKGGFLLFHLSDDLIAVAPMPAPYPWSDLKGPCETSWMWPKHISAMSVKDHRKHVLITSIGGKAVPIQRRLALTQVVAMAAELPGVMGIYWGDATLVHYPPVFSKMGLTLKGPPLYLWVDFRVFPNQDGSSGMFTTGMRALGQMDFEIPRIEMPPGKLREWSVNIAYYLLENGANVKDGNTIGVSAEQQIRVRYLPSMFGKDGLVMRFEV
jgi:hypothetical protein